MIQTTRKQGLPASVLSSTRGRVTLAVMVFGAFLYYSLPWYGLREPLLEVLRYLLDGGDRPVVRDGLTLVIDGLRFDITRDCTYLEWQFYALPMLWRPRPWWMNLLVLVGAGLGMAGLNVLRIWLALTLHVEGHSWWLVHDGPDALLWYGSILAIAYFWLRSFRSPIPPRGGDMP